MKVAGVCSGGLHSFRLGEANCNQVKRLAKFDGQFAVSPRAVRYHEIQQTTFLTRRLHFKQFRPHRNRDAGAAGFHDERRRGLSSWEEIDLLSFRAYYDKGKKLLGSKQWTGSQPEFQPMRWIEGKATQ